MVTLRARGFSLIELIVALAILATILSIAVPRYFSNIETAQENVLREDLYIMRSAIDHYFSDQSVYPNELADLVTKNYLRAVPTDPFTQSSNSWVVVAPSNPSLGAVYDIHSGSPNMAKNGTWLASW
ncbi:MAG: prepilin-type N-terminal cleavage/methylation domain-containing protein [Burkholderiaceae bacterium]|nr:prepilin-type N-terminal cleavage/methylation domain-containing protein [Burkholderiaceae bacterium]